MCFQNWERGGHGGAPKLPPPSQHDLPLKSKTLAPRTQRAWRPRVRPSPDCQSAAFVTPGPRGPRCTSGPRGPDREGVPARGGRSRADRRWEKGDKGGGPQDQGGRREPERARCKVIPRRPIPARSGEGSRGTRLPRPRHTLPQVGWTPPRGAALPAPHHAPPKRSQHCHHNRNLGNSSPDDEGGWGLLPNVHARLQPQPRFPKLVRGS